MAFFLKQDSVVNSKVLPIMDDLLPASRPFVTLQEVSIGAVTVDSLKNKTNLELRVQEYVGKAKGKRTTMLVLVHWSSDRFDFVTQNLRAGSNLLAAGERTFNQLFTSRWKKRVWGTPNLDSKRGFEIGMTKMKRRGIYPRRKSSETKGKCC